VLTFGARDRLIQFGSGPGGPRLERPHINPPDLPGAVGAEAAGPVVADADVEKAVILSNTILANNDLPGSAKLFGMAVSAGLAAHQARALVQSQLTRAGGDQTAALAGGLDVLTGVGEIGPTVTERVERAHPVENLVSMLLRNRRFTPVAPALIAPIAVPPDPRRHSIVVIGGSRVGVTGNVTTAGVHVHDAAQAVENNV
jgi:hypothetical protein